jgi:hypothetical protein
MAFPYYPQNYYGYQTAPTPVPQTPQYAPASGIIWVSGEQEASMYPVGPNNAVALWERSGKAVYMKSADATGKPTMRTYDLVERKIPPSESVFSEAANLPSYATKEALDDVLAEISALRADIDGMKGDIYGIAGRKKKKPEAEDE